MDDTISLEGKIISCFFYIVRYLIFVLFCRCCARVEEQRSNLQIQRYGSKVLNTNGVFFGLVFPHGPQQSNMMSSPNPGWRHVNSAVVSLCLSVYYYVIFDITLNTWKNKSVFVKVCNYILFISMIFTQHFKHQRCYTSPWFVVIN